LYVSSYSDVMLIVLQRNSGNGWKKDTKYGYFSIMIFMVMHIEMQKS
jgi:hypothetical protein